MKYALLIGIGYVNTRHASETSNVEIVDGTSDSKMDEKKVEAKGDEISHEHKSEGHGEEAETHHAGLGFPEISIFLGFIGMFLFWVFSTFSKGSLVPTNDAYLKESMNHHI